MIERRSGEISGAEALPPGACSRPTVWPFVLSTSARSRLPSTTRGGMTIESASGVVARGSGSRDGPDDVVPEVNEDTGDDESAVVVGTGGPGLPADAPPLRVSANTVAAIATTATATTAAITIRFRFRFGGGPWRGSCGRPGHGPDPDGGGP